MELGTPVHSEELQKVWTLLLRMGQWRALKANVKELEFDPWDSWVLKQRGF